VKIDFEHHQSAHCENGVISNLLKFHGLDVSEAMIFGVGSGLFFAYMPFVKLNGLPVTSFRPVPGLIFSRATRRLGIKMKKVTFRNPSRAMSALDGLLEQRIPVGLQVGAYHLSYFPTKYRFHFNMHNIVVFGKEDGKYLISDPVMEAPTALTYDELIRVRYAKGTFAPRGKMYYPLEIPEKVDFDSAIRKGISKTCYDMLRIPIPLFGVRGIRFLARQVIKWPARFGDRVASLHLGQVVRMQEEIGTGGAGFRFIFAAFLQEASKILQAPELFEISREMTDVGDHWREFATQAARIIKGRSSGDESYASVSRLLLAIADKEERFFQRLQAAVS
jgi:hypothetical protein